MDVLLYSDAGRSRDDGVDVRDCLVSVSIRKYQKSKLRAKKRIERERDRFIELNRRILRWASSHSAMKALQCPIDIDDRFPFIGQPEQ